MGTHIVTIPNDDLGNPIPHTWQDLQTAGYGFNEPFVLRLAEDDTFMADEVVRIIPKKRMVAFGHWRGKAVVAKIFIDKHHAKKHMEQDAAGVKLLRDNKVPTPVLYYQGYCREQRAYVLLFERLVTAKNLETIWLERRNVQELLPLLKAVMIELATQHVLGLLQQDLHLKNFLITRKKIYTLDGDQIEYFPHLLPKKQSMQNLALFLAQFGVGFEAYQEMLFKHYAKSRGWLLKESDTIELFLTIKKWNETRWNKFEKKIFRASSDFIPIKTWSMQGMYERKHAGKELMTFFQNPDAFILHPSAVILKAGRSSTVAKVTFDQREYVIKRYNMKNAWHRLRRTLRHTRAYHAWRLAQKLCLFGIRTAKPVAYLENKVLGFRGKSFFVMEYVAGKGADEYLQIHADQEEKVFDIIKKITHLLKNIAKLDITHGDLKLTNVLIDEQEQPVLIDLDGTLEHGSLSSLRSTWRKEIKRLLENFHHQPKWIERFKQELGEQ